MRWANILSMFHFQIVHVEGKKNVVADALSRKPQISAVSIPYHHELDDMKDQYAVDEDFARVYDQVVNGQPHEHYLLKDGFMLMHGRLCISRPLRQKVMTESHSPPYAGHRGIDASVKAVETFFYWPTLRRDVETFVRQCLVCQKVKFDRQKAPGLLQPLPIPDKPWESIAMDFVFDLPRTQTGNDGIWTIICRFSKQAHFIPVRKKIKPDQMARLFMCNIFKYHGMPQSIVSDRDPRMTSLFWRGMFVQSMDETYGKIKHALEKTQAKQKRAADMHRRELVFKENDWVLLRFEKARLKKQKGKESLFPKLSMRYYGPFQVTEKISDVCYRLKLPEQWKIHNAFHVSLLRPFVGDVPVDLPVENQPEVEELDEILVPEQILAHKERKVSA